MAFDLPPGAVIRYPYLWARQARAGETEGRKKRPVCLAVALPVRGKTCLFLLALTSQPPTPDQSALEIPPLELARIRLDASKPAWLILSEYNFDVAEDSFYYEPQEQPLGRFSEAFLARIIMAALPILKSTRSRVGRTV